jgi:ankyrin repeat protein
MNPIPPLPVFDLCYKIDADGQEALDALRSSLNPEEQFVPKVSKFLNNKFNHLTAYIVEQPEHILDKFLRSILLHYAEIQNALLFPDYEKINDFAILLIQAGASINQERDLETPLTLICQQLDKSNHPQFVVDLIRQLLNEGANPNPVFQVRNAAMVVFPFKRGDLPLMLIAKCHLNYGQALQAARLMIDAGAEVNAKNFHGETALHTAFSSCDNALDPLFMVQFLLAHHAAINAIDNLGKTLLYLIDYAFLRTQSITLAAQQRYMRVALFLRTNGGLNLGARLKEPAKIVAIIRKEGYGLRLTERFICQLSCGEEVELTPGQVSYSICQTSLTGSQWYKEIDENVFVPMPTVEVLAQNGLTAKEVLLSTDFV